MDKQETQPSRREQNPFRETEKERKAGMTKEGSRFPWWRRVLTGLGVRRQRQEQVRGVEGQKKTSRKEAPGGFSGWGMFLWRCRYVWGGFPWWRRLLIILGIIGIGFAIWFAVQPDSTPPTYNLSVTVNPSGSGNISPTDGNYTDGAEVALTATSASDYEFVSWSGDASGASPAVTVTMDSDKDVVANFRIIQYTLATSVSPPEGGNISPSSGTYDSGSSVTLTATPASSYEFVSWSGDASGAIPAVTITMDSDKDVVANFVTIRQEITHTMPTGISGSVVTYFNVLKRGDVVDGFVELTGEYYSHDWSFDWTFEILGPEGRRVESWTGGHWVKRTHHDFSFIAPYSGSYKIRVRHNSLYDKYLVIEIRPKGWSFKRP